MIHNHAGATSPRAACILLALAAATAVQPAQAAPASTSPGVSIRKWAVCDGTTDDRDAAAQAFDAASHGKFTLVIDCPVKIHVGMDIARPIFIDDGTTVVFAKGGLFITDNVFVPTWVMANVKQVRMTGWRVRYVGGMPTDPETGGYSQNGNWVAIAGNFRPGAAFHNKILTPWLAEHRGIRFIGGRDAVWSGPGAASAMFLLVGETSDVTIEGMKLFVPPNAGGDRFIPMAFFSAAGFRSGTRVDASTPITNVTAAVPRRIRMSDIDIDGCYMGFDGTYPDSTFTRITSRRYGDLQGPNGEDPGGKGNWFAPPHLFYLNTRPGTQGLENRNVHISDVTDLGIRSGVARDTTPGKLSGYALSLKIGADDSSVVNYLSNRPDGFLDLLASRNLRIRNLRGSYDSNFLNNLFPGIRFPQPPYRNVTIEQVRITDKALHPRMPMISNSVSPANAGLVLRDVVVTSAPSAAARTLPKLSGAGSTAQILFRDASPESR